MVSQEVINDRTELVSLKQATKLLGISVTTIYRYEKKGPREGLNDNRGKLIYDFVRIVNDK